MRHMASTVFAFALTVLSGTVAMAADPVQQQNSNAVWFENWIGLSNASLTVAAPNGKITQIYTETGTPVFELDGEEVPDGVYRYELTAATDETVEIVNETDNGRGDAQKNTMAKPFHTSGHFTVSRGVIISPEVAEEEG